MEDGWPLCSTWAIWTLQAGPGLVGLLVYIVFFFFFFFLRGVFSFGFGVSTCLFHQFLLVDFSGFLRIFTRVYKLFYVGFHGSEMVFDGLMPGC